MSELRPSSELLRAVESDLRPVLPLAPPWRRALVLLPLGAAVLAGLPAYWGYRSNLPQLGPLFSWGLSALQALAGLALVGAALREGIPGRKLSAPTLLATLGAALALLALVTWLTEVEAPTAISPAVRVRYIWECLGIATVSGIPALAAAAWLAWRSLPNRPWIAGALYGMGAGLITDSGMRLFCWVSEPDHVAWSHGGAILLLMLAGAVISRAAEALHSRFDRNRLRGR